MVEKTHEDAARYLLKYKYKYGRKRKKQQKKGGERKKKYRTRVPYPVRYGMIHTYAAVNESWCISPLLHNHYCTTALRYI